MQMELNKLENENENMKIKILDFDDIDRMEIRFGFDMARLWWRNKATPDGSYYGGIRIALGQIKNSLGIIKRNLLEYLATMVLEVYRILLIQIYLGLL